MSVSSRIQIPGDRPRNQLIRFDVDDGKARVVLTQEETIRLLDHHAQSGRSLLLVGFNSLGHGGELAVGTGLDRHRVKISLRRSLRTPDQGSSNANLRWARWIDDEHILALIDQTLGLWNIVSGEQLYGITGIDHRCQPALSGGRSLVAIPYQGAVQLFFTATGKPLGRIPVEKQVPGVSFSPECDALAIVTSRRMRLWHLASAALAADVESRQSLGMDRPTWIDSDLVLSSSGVLISRSRGLPIWRYDVSATEAVAVGKHLAMLRRHPASELAITSLPHESASNAMGWIDQRPAEIETATWRILGRSVWGSEGWIDRDVQISAMPGRLR